MISASPHWQQEILEVFSVSEDYGVEDSGQLFSTAFNQPSLTVPRIDLQVTFQQLTTSKLIFASSSQ